MTIFKAWMLVVSKAVGSYVLNGLLISDNIVCFCYPESSLILTIHAGPALPYIYEKNTRKLLL